MASTHPLSPVTQKLRVIREESSVSRSPFTSGLFQAWIGQFHDEIRANEKWLTELDRAIGDADHGVNMRRGMEQVKAHMVDLKGADLSSQFRMVSGHLTSSVGGASGPLYGAFFLHASCVVPAGKLELRLGDFASCLEAGLQGVVGLGHAQAGDKTMVDVLIPVVTAFKSMSRRQSSAADIFSEGVLIAESAMKSTIPMQASKGRASYLGARSVGHQDPGATSIFLLVRALAVAATRLSSPEVKKPQTNTPKLIP